MPSINLSSATDVEPYFFVAIGNAYLDFLGRLIPCAFAINAQPFKQQIRKKGLSVVMTDKLR
jgi:hypothetical protein